MVVDITTESRNGVMHMYRLQTVKLQVCKPHDTLAVPCSRKYGQTVKTERLWNDLGWLDQWTLHWWASALFWQSALKETCLTKATIPQENAKMHLFIGAMSICLPNDPSILHSYQTLHSFLSAQELGVMSYSNQPHPLSKSSIICNNY